MSNLTKIEDFAEEMKIDEEELFTNSATRLAIAVVADVSGSMTGEPIIKLNGGLNLFSKEANDDKQVARSAEVAIVTFGGIAKVELNFASVLNQKIPTLTASGSTPMGAAVNLALDILDERKKTYKKAGVEYWQPWMVLMTDGAPTDSIDEAAARTSALVMNKKLTIFPIGVGENANLKILEEFSPKRSPLRLKGYSFKEFFEWLIKSVSEQSRQTSNETVDTPDWPEKS